MVTSLRPLSPHVIASRPFSVSDYRFAGGIHTITAISVPSPGNLKQGLPLRIDNEIVAGECELTLPQEGAMDDGVPQELSDRSVNALFGHF